MQIQFDIDVVMIILTIVGCVIAFIRVQSKQAAHEKEIERVEKDYKVAIQTQKEDHEKVIAAMKETHSESSRALWEKLGEFNQTLLEVVKGISRLEGRRESDKG